MPKVSIIMPTYNVEKYFKQCIESVINQTLEDIEIIPVDDGSPDNCGAIMDEYAANDHRIKPIHQANGGYGKAVNAGIAAATGEYIGIVETDDYIEPDMYEKLYNQAKRFDVDVCKAGFNYYFGNQRYKAYRKFSSIAPENQVFTLKDKPEILNYHVSIWSAIYRRKYLNDNKIRVIETKSASYQDMPFAASVYAHGATITILDDCLLNYRAEDGMQSSTIRTDDRLKQMPIMCMEAIKIFKNTGCWDFVKQIAYRQFYNCSVNFFFKTDDKYKPDYFVELVNLFEEFDRNYLSSFTKEEQKIINCILKNDFKTISNYITTKKILNNLKKIRKSFISIHINKNDRSIQFFGNELLSIKKDKIQCKIER